MKRTSFFSIALLLISMCLFSCNSDDEKEVETIVTYEELPERAQQFIKSYFNGEDNIDKIVKNEDGSVPIFEVDTKDGYEIVFNQMGFWQEIVAPAYKTIPVSILPEPIQQTLSYQYHGYGIIVVNTEGENYHIVLSNNQGGDSIGLTFNQSGEIVSTDQNPV